MSMPTTTSRVQIPNKVSPDWLGTTKPRDSHVDAGEPRASSPVQSESTSPRAHESARARDPRFLLALPCASRRPRRMGFKFASAQQRRRCRHCRDPRESESGNQHDNIAHQIHESSQCEAANHYVIILLQPSYNRVSARRPPIPSPLTV